MNADQTTTAVILSEAHARVEEPALSGAEGTPKMPWVKLQLQSIFSKTERLTTDFTDHADWEQYPVASTQYPLAKPSPKRGDGE